MALYSLFKAVCVRDHHSGETAQTSDTQTVISTMNTTPATWTAAIHVGTQCLCWWWTQICFPAHIWEEARLCARFQICSWIQKTRFVLSASGTIWRQLWSLNIYRHVRLEDKDNFNKLCVQRSAAKWQKHLFHHYHCLQMNSINIAVVIFDGMALPFHGKPQGKESTPIPHSSYTVRHERRIQGGGGLQKQLKNTTLFKIC